MKESLLFSLLLMCAVCGAAEPSSRAAGPPKPNIILIMPDDLGYGDYRCLGNPIMHTPSVDTFKKESLLFTQFHVSPTCSPCRAALMSGRHEFKNGVKDWGIADNTLVIYLGTDKGEGGDPEAGGDDTKAAGKAKKDKPKKKVGTDEAGK